MFDIQSYIHLNLFEPGRTWPEYWFKQRSYSRWVVYELLEKIRLSDDPEETVIFDFIKELDYYEELAEANGDKDKCLIFNTAKNEIEEVLYFVHERRNNGVKETDGGFRKQCKKE